MKFGVKTSLVLMISLALGFSSSSHFSSYGQAKSKIGIENDLVANKKYNKDFNFKGSVNGIKGQVTVIIGVDGKKLTEATTDRKGNYKVDMPITGYSQGYHNVETSFSYKNKKYSISKKINYYRYLVYDIEGIEDNKIYTKDLKISGYALHGKGIKKVNFYLDGMSSPIGKVKANRPSLDAAPLFPNYDGSNKAGFSYKLDLEKLKLPDGRDLYGKHSLEVEILSNADDKKVKVYNIEFAKRQSYDDLTVSPDAGKLENKDVRLKGWFISPAGGENVVVTLDGQAVTGIVQGTDNEDDGGRYADYDNSLKSDFELNISRDKIMRGVHTIEISYFSGLEKIKSRKLEFEMVKPKYDIQAQKPDFINNNLEKSMVFSGYSAHPSGVSKVSVLVNGVPQPNVSGSLPSKAASDIYPEYTGIGNSGFQARIDTSAWTIQPHRIEVKVTANDGETFVYSDLLGLKGVSYTFMQYPLSYYTNAQFSKGLNVSPTNFKKKANMNEITEAINPDVLVGNEQYKYVFMKLNYFEGVTADNLDKLLAGKGVLEGMGAAFLQAGKLYNVNPIYLVSHALHETGNGASTLSKGILVTQIKHKVFENGKRVSKLVPVNTPKMVYNIYGVGAYDDDPKNYGSSTAFTGGDQLGSISPETYDSALNGDLAWDTVEKGIIGGAKFISSGYVNDDRYSDYYKQNTLYKMKWDIYAIDNGKSPHQYATDAAWARKQTKRIKELIDIMDNPQIQFEVPIFKAE